MDSRLKIKREGYLCFLARDTVRGAPEHRSWVAAARWVVATISQMIVAVVEGALEMRLDKAEHVGEGVY